MCRWHKDASRPALVCPAGAGFRPEYPAFPFGRISPVGIPLRTFERISPFGMPSPAVAGLRFERISPFGMPAFPAERISPFGMYPARSLACGCVLCSEDMFKLHLRGQQFTLELHIHMVARHLPG